jgi:hypothetical protein
MKVLALSYFLGLHNPRSVLSTIGPQSGQSRTNSTRVDTHAHAVYTHIHTHLHTYIHLSYLQTSTFKPFKAACNANTREPAYYPQRHFNERLASLEARLASLSRGPRGLGDQIGHLDSMIKFDTQWVPAIKKLCH